MDSRNPDTAVESGVLPEIVTVEAPGSLWRVATPQTGLKFNEIDPITSAGPHGNRYDVSGGGVLYCGTDVRGCFAETLARFRVNLNSPVARAAAKDAANGSAFMAPGNIPASWRTNRRRFHLRTVDALPFVDIEHEATRAHLTVRLGAVLGKYDIEALDVPTIRGYNRRLTRELARWIYTQIDEEGHPLYSGIRYISKHGDYECWALFDGTEVEEVSSLSVECRDNDLLHVARMFNLTVH